MSAEWTCGVGMGCVACRVGCVSRLARVAKPDAGGFLNVKKQVAPGFLGAEPRGTGNELLAISAAGCLRGDRVRATNRA